jgi:hypothetical protein
VSDTDSLPAAAGRVVGIAKKIWHWFGMFCAGLFILVFPALMIFGIVTGIREDKEQERERQARLASSSPSAALTTRMPIDWMYEGAVCADGTLSFSVGKQGACHHGGVAGRWIAADGTQVVCRSFPPPRTREQVDRQMARFGRIFC